MTKKLLLIDQNPRAFAPLAEHLRSIGYRLQTADDDGFAVEQVIRVRPHAVLLRKWNHKTRKQIQENMRVADVPIVMVRPARRHVKENVEALQLALFDATMLRLR